MQPYKTSDINFAAYLCLQGYTLAGAMPANDSTKRLVFFLFWTRNDDPRDINEDIVTQIEAYNAGRYREFANKMKMCRQAMHNPITEEQLKGSF